MRHVVHSGLCSMLITSKCPAAQELMEQYGAHKALLYNIGQSSRDTGVRYKDVAGIDNVKADIAEVMKMVLGDQSYRQMGARPPRVSTCLPDAVDAARLSRAWYKGLMLPL